MWKREEAPRPSQPVNQPASAPAPEPAPRQDTTRQSERDVVNIGKSVIIKGELSGSEDLTIEGQVDGKIELRQNVLTIGSNGKIKAEIFAKTLVVLGEVHGNVTATERVEIRESGSVEGDVSAPRVAIADGAHFRGSIDMQRGGGKAGEAKAPEARPMAAAGPVAVSAAGR